MHAEMLDKVMSDIDKIFGENTKRSVMITDRCQNMLCINGRVEVSNGMEWVEQICPDCRGSGYVKVRVGP